MVWLFRAILFFPLVCSVVSAQCSTPAQRKAWHTLSNDDKLAYINAELCLMKLPAKTSMEGVITRFDDFQALHVHGAYMTHFVGAFLPFHRLMTYAHETALREECGYKGYQPFWYEQKDAGRFSSSDVFDPIYGFGGNGSDEEGGCITDGPFANYTSPFGPGYELTVQCIDRKFDDDVSSFTSRNQVDYCISQPDWISTWQCIEGNPHAGGHNGVGGQMARGGSSPGDPLFYLHHAWIDKLWWDWQSKDLPARLSEMGGTNLMRKDSGFRPPPPEYPQPGAMPGDPGDTTTLNHVLFMFGIMENKIIADVMNIHGSFLCYEYIEPKVQ
ncbi:tyrosinase [Histoplasma capsulatum G186AR]|uniref:Tyrosinase n=1 Tax=Ajellomyces capsulatus TaxID=5037 RepID=A0A8H8D9Z1_AJECA|nr:tyrosinase [Histoplasma capsulatum]QSS76017.1 tyrosinase [Histoplasma capsulatum G186AR]